MNRLNDDLNTGRGFWITLLLILLAVAGAEVLLIFEEPGVGLGLCAWLYAAVMYAARGRFSMSTREWLVVGLLFLSGLQSIRFASLSNFLVLATCVLYLNGASAWRGLASGWAQWIESGLSFLRPRGVLQALGGKALAGADGDLRGRLQYGLRVALPAVALLFVFGLLLSAGNAVLGKWLADISSLVERWLRFIEFPSIERVVAWGFFAGVALVVTCPPRPLGIARILSADWPALGMRDARVRRHQWLAVLLAMNLLFLFSSITDVVYLWLSQELPEGISHSRYVHQGVYVLIFTTVLSALILGCLTLHSGAVRDDRRTKALAFAWMLQNLFLISGVFLRLRIYVEAYGHTPKRVYVALFLLLVAGGYLLLAAAIARLKTFKWLAGANLLLLAGYFSVLQFLDVPGWVARRNVELYRSGTIVYPEPQYLRQIGSHAVPCLISIYQHPQSQADREQALSDLRDLADDWIMQPSSWQSFQLRDYRNRQRYAAFAREQGLGPQGP